ncbi:lysylphosphatidylglycerol synthase transmembrane domain-containing protein [uncultured Salinisphaera sp.]|uniref:lysylphosphatidylglycerol synthase transmembrane domain-containing protein n=1 Tax=uncultured Salinisphaera sp. TaxID=359372 RepID=UPI0032B2FD27|tara:strand:- start:33894 stop:34856 length:963 start_codon:yes stop_codon:yes gene_type:complete
MVVEVLHPLVLSHPVIRFVVTAGLIAGLWWVVDIARVGRLVADLRWPWVGAGLALVQAQIVLSALRWRVTAARLGEPLSHRRAIGEYYLASLLNQILPGGVAGDVIRAGRGAGDRAQSGWQAGAAAIVLERLAGQVMLFVVAGVGLVASAVAGETLLPAARAGWLAVAGLLAALAALAGLVGRWAAGRRYLARIGRAVGRAWLARDVIGQQLVLSGLIVTAYLTAFAAASAAIGAPLGLFAVWVLVPATLLTMLLPVSIAGWGLREAAAAALWPLAGATAADGVAASIVYGVISLVGAAPGLVVWWRRPSGPAQAVSRRA